MSPAQGTSNCCSTFTYVLSFLGGIVVLALVEFALLLYVIARLLKGKPSRGTVPAIEIEKRGGSISLPGNVWVVALPEGDWSKAIIKPTAKDKKKEKDGQMDGSRRGASTRNPMEIAPMWRHAVLKDKVLFLKSVDGTEEKISIEGCEVLSISSGPGPNRKWGKKFPIKLHHADREVYRGCKDCLLYSKSGYEKEAWCEALRASARMGSFSNDWVLKMKREFRDYTHGTEKHNPYLNMFHTAGEGNHFDANGKDERSDGQRNSDEGHSRRWLILKKLARRASKGMDHKETRFSNVVEEVGHFSQRMGLLSHEQDEGSVKGKEGAITNEHEDVRNASNGSTSSHTSTASDSSCTSCRGVVQREAAGTVSEEGDKSAAVATQKDKKESQHTHQPKKERPEKEIDQGLLCLNMIVARLYFDFYHSPTRVAGIQRLFQRLLSRIRTPSYIKSITIKEIDLGRDPPFATALRMLPSDAGGALSMEIDLEWHGGGFITCETHIDVRDQTAQEKVASQLTEPGSAGAAAAAIFSGIEGDLETAGAATLSAAVVEARQAGVPSSSRAGDEGSRRGRWMQSVKSIISGVADQVSQVPLLLKIRLVSVKGTGLLRLRAPPADRIWFSFKEMPEIELVPEPCIGDHRISSGPLGAFIANQLKVLIRESMVMPFCEDVMVHWMMAEKDDWLPQSTVPLPFSPLQASESERPPLKQNNDPQPRPRNENLQSSYLQSTPNGQNKPQRGQASNSNPQSAPPGPPKQQKALPVPAPQTQSTLQEPANAQAAHPPLSHPQSSPQGPGVNTAQPQRTASSAHLPSEPSIPTRLSTAPSAASLSEDMEFDLTRPLLDRDECSKGEVVGSSRESDLSASDRALDAAYNDFCQQSKGSASESDLQFLANQELPKDSDPNSRISRRSKMLSIGKKMGTQLDERRRIVVEKLRERKADSSEGSVHSRMWGHGS